MNNKIKTTLLTGMVIGGTVACANAQPVMASEMPSNNSSSTTSSAVSVNTKEIKEEGQVKKSDNMASLIGTKINIETKTTTTEGETAIKKVSEDDTQIVSEKVTPIEIKTEKKIETEVVNVKDEKELPSIKDGKGIDWKEVSKEGNTTTSKAEYVSDKDTKIEAIKKDTLIEGQEKVVVDKEAWDETKEIKIKDVFYDKEVKVGDVVNIDGIDYEVTKVDNEKSSHRVISVKNFETYSTIANHIEAPDGFHFNGYNSTDFDSKYWKKVIDVNIKKKTDNFKELTTDYKTLSWDNTGKLYCDKNNDNQQDQDTSAGGVNVYGDNINTKKGTNEYDKGASSERITRDLPVYYYLEKGKIIINELAGSLIAPYSEVTITGQNSGTIIAESVTYTSGESHRNISDKHLKDVTDDIYKISGKGNKVIHHDTITHTEKEEDRHEISYSYKELKEIIDIITTSRKETIVTEKPKKDIPKHEESKHHKHHNDTPQEPEVINHTATHEPYIIPQEPVIVPVVNTIITTATPVIDETQPTSTIIEDIQIQNDVTPIIEDIKQVKEIKNSSIPKTIDKNPLNILLGLQVATIVILLLTLFGNKKQK